jgi:hypothetical protein
MDLPRLATASVRLGTRFRHEPTRTTVRVVVHFSSLVCEMRRIQPDGASQQRANAVAASASLSFLFILPGLLKKKMIGKIDC